MTASSDAVVGAFNELSAAAVSDALDRYRLPGSAQGIGSVTGTARSVGRAFTVRYVPVGAVKGTVGDYIDDVLPGQMVVLDNGGRTDCTVWGDILTAVATERGVAGTVVHGVCRDVRRAMDLGYPLFSRGRFMRTGKDRVEVVAVETTVSLGTVQVQPGDIVVADADGVVVVPRSVEDKVLAAAQEINAAEERILAGALSGKTLKQARADEGYHLIQRGEE